MSEPEFPHELVERCRQAFAKAKITRDRYPHGILAILRESGHAELVAALKEARSFVSGWGTAPPALKEIDAALRKAGAL